MNNFTFRLIGSTGYEILNSDGWVLAWTVDEVTAARIVALLNEAESG